jgi:hypothetical protein
VKVVSFHVTLNADGIENVKVLVKNKPFLPDEGEVFNCFRGDVLN